MKQSYNVYNDFSKGLNTDFEGVNQDPLSVTDIDNFIIDNRGVLKKRNGIKKESSLDSGIAMPEKDKNTSITSYVWKNINNTDERILLLQFGEKIYFYKYSNNISEGKISSEINLLDYLTSERLVLEDLRMDFTEIKGRLLCTHRQINPFYLEYSNEEIRVNNIDITIRDYYGKETTFDDDERPETLTYEHMYNLYNQGWDAWAVFSAYNAKTEGTTGTPLNKYPSYHDSVNALFSTTVENRNSNLFGYMEGYTSGQALRYPNNAEELEQMIQFDLNSGGTLSFYSDGSNDDCGAIYRTAGKGYGINIMDFSKMHDLSNRFKNPTGRIIKRAFESSEVTTVVERPIIEKPIEEIDRNKWNNFHFLENVNDIFLDDNGNVKLVIELDKEHGLYGGFQQSTSCVLSCSIGHYNELEQVVMEDTNRRIYEYELPDVMKDFSTPYGDRLTVRRDEGLWYADGGYGSNLGYTLKNWLNSQAVSDIFSILNTGKTESYLINLTNDPHEYKAIHISSNNVGTTGYFATTRLAMNDEHLGSYNYKSEWRGQSLKTGPMSSTSLEIDIAAPTSTFNYFASLSSSGPSKTNNSTGSYLCGGFDSYNNTNFNTTQFDYQSIKRKNISSQKIETFFLTDITCNLEALSTKKCIITINKEYLPNKTYWNFNATKDGELICYDDLYKTLKISISQTLYDKMKNNYESMKRDEYASLKLEEEYGEVADFFSVNKVIGTSSLDTKSIYDYVVDPNNNYSYQREQLIGITLELNKPHGKNTYARKTVNTEDTAWRKNISILSGDYTTYSSNDLFNSKRVLIPTAFRYKTKNYSNVTNSVGWGNYFSDYARHLSGGSLMKLKDSNDRPDYAKSIVIDNIQVNTNAPALGSSSTYFTNLYTEGKPTNMIPNTLVINNIASSGTNSNIPETLACGHKCELSYYPRHNESEYNSYIADGWKRRDRYTYGDTGIQNLASTGQPEFITCYYMLHYSTNTSKFSQQVYAPEVRGDIMPCSYDFYECHMANMNLNMIKNKRKSLPETTFVEFVGDRYINLTIRPTDHLVYEDLDELILSEDTVQDSMFIIERNGMILNLHEFLNMKFSLDDTISREEIRIKRKAYREEWTWDMDGNGSIINPLIQDEEDLEYIPIQSLNNEVETYSISNLEWNEIIEDNIEDEDIVYELEEVAEEFRPNCCETYAGRAFYGGINCEKYNNTIFYSKVLTTDIENEIQECYALNDPTAKYNNSPLATDGGYIKISEAGDIMGMEVINSMLCVIASNGVYAVFGGGGYFTATNHAVKKISNVGCISLNSIKVINNTLIYASKYSINKINLDSINEDLIPTDITNMRVNDLYNEIPFSSKKYIKTIYDDVKGITYFLYNNEETISSNPSFNSILIYNVIKDSFFKFSFNENNYKIKDGFINSFNNIDDIRLKLICYSSVDEDVNFFDFSNVGFYDFDNTEYSASVRTSSQIVSSPVNSLVGGSVTSHLVNNDNSSCIIDAEYGFDSTRKTKPTEVFKSQNDKEVVYSKTMLRGKGNNMILNYYSPPNKDCEILGFEVYFKVKENQ